ncbi:hypothetical protein C8Q80DRAFT_1217985 [Daedaleopsis nitida]|nr:hypothetical protein C8Q80DRAFT_1217985 [Daedaleopsis nitida]
MPKDNSQDSALARAGALSGRSCVRGVVGRGSLQDSNDSPRTLRQQKPRKPREGNEIRASSLRPHVFAKDCIIRWQTPAGGNFKSRMAQALPPAACATIFELTASNYGAGLLRFTQFCDEMNIPETLRMPAPEFLLVAFLARHAGQVQDRTMGNWLSGLRIFHAVNGAQWEGEKLLQYAKKGARKLNPETKPKRPPVTYEHMLALVKGLDMGNSFDIAVFALACAAFWGCRRLGELLIPTLHGFNPKRHVSREVKVGIRTLPNGTAYAIFHIPWTKTTGEEGANVILTEMPGLLDPVKAIQHHLNSNTAAPAGSPLFSFDTGSGRGWDPMVRDWFLSRCNDVWTKAGLENLTGHCFRIGGATELLLRGTHPDVVATLGSWKSKAFLDYWRRIEVIIPLFISQASDLGRIQLMRQSMEDFERRHGSTRR